MQAILSWLPGYMFDGHNLRSTGSAIPPTQHVSEKNGEIIYYCRPLFFSGPTVGMYVRKQGILDALQRGEC